VTVSYAIANGVNGLASNYRVTPNPLQVRATIVPLMPSIGTQDMPSLGTVGRQRVYVPDVGSSGRAQGLAADQTAPQVCRPMDIGSKDSRITAEVCTGQR
jgi:hypothetical protein